ncbi:hypothetical protein V6Z11_1Z088200 [Gossypium hirsutum]
MARDWDLYAVVRSCTSVANTTRAVENNNNNENCSSSFEDPLACLASLTFEEDDDPFPFPTFHSSRNRQLHQHQRLQHQQEQPAATGIGSPLTPTSAPLFTFAGFGNQQQVQPQSHQQQQTRAQPPVQTPRSRKRNQQKRTVCHVTADKLSSDPWAWRKYGQSPSKALLIQGSKLLQVQQLKGCSARKQVERSNLDSDIFIITYTGEHTHPKPTSWNSLAGSTFRRRNHPYHLHCFLLLSSLCHESLPYLSTTTLSAPKTPPPPSTKPVILEVKKKAFYMDVESDEDDEDLLFPTYMSIEDLFKGLEELVGSGSNGVGIVPTFGDNFSSWSYR